MPNAKGADFKLGHYRFARQLLAIFAEAGSTVDLSDGKYRYDNLAEMQNQVGNRVKALDIRGENPSVHFLLNKKEMTPVGAQVQVEVFNELRTEDLYLASEVLFLRVWEFLNARQLPYLIRPGFIILSAAAGTTIFVMGVKGQFGQPPFSMKMFVLLIGLVFTFVISALLSVPVNDSIYLKRRAESPSLWQRTKDDVFVRSVATILGVVVGVRSGVYLAHSGH
jgi:hypothetical protein